MRPTPPPEVVSESFDDPALRILDAKERKGRKRRKWAGAVAGMGGPIRFPVAECDPRPCALCQSHESEWTSMVVVEIFASFMSLVFILYFITEPLSRPIDDPPNVKPQRHEIAESGDHRRTRAWRREVRRIADRL